MNRVLVSRDVLRWAVERARLAPAQIAKKLPNIREWEEGTSQPTLHQLENLARVTRTPLGYLFLDSPPEERLPIPYFRTIANAPAWHPSPELLETVHIMQRRQEWMREYLLEQGSEPLPFIRSAQPKDASHLIARRLHEVVCLAEDWAVSCATWEQALGVFRDAIEGAGILVVGNGVVENNTHRKLDPQEFRGFVLVDEIAPLVFLNTVDAKAAQMFTLAHELAHLIFGSSAAFDLRSMEPADELTEQACNKVAAEFLVPEERMRQAWSSLKGLPEPFQALARRFKVSALVTARRALDLGLVSRQEFFDFYDEYLRDERRRSASRADGGDFYKNQNLRVGRLFASAVTRAVGEGKLLYSEAYRLTGLHGAAFERYTRSILSGASK